MAIKGLPKLRIKIFEYKKLRCVFALRMLLFSIFNNKSMFLYK